MGFVQKNFTCMQIYKCSLGIGRIQILGYVRIANVFYDCFDTIKRLRKPLFSVSLLIGKMPVRENLRINYVRLINSKNLLIFSYLLNVIERSSFSPQSYDCCFFIEINENCYESNNTFKVWLHINSVTLYNNLRDNKLNIKIKYGKFGGWSPRSWIF